jgi:hypothetical protein
MKKILPFSLILIAAMILTACGVAAQKTQAPSEFYGLPPSAGGAPGVTQDSAMPASAPEVNRSTTVDNSVAPGTAVQRIVIKNADLAIVVADVEGRMKNIQVMAQQMGGFVVSSNLGQTYTSTNIKVPEAQIVIRVPAEKLEEAMTQIKKDAVEVQSENISGQDVTAEYVDLQSRLKNYEAAEAQLNDILKTATKTEDVVNIFNQLVYYREQIELVKGQMKYYEEAAALSAISVRIIAQETIQPVVIGTWQPKGVALKAVQNLINFLKGFTEFLINFVILILPVLIIIFGSLYLVFLAIRALFRKMRGNRVKKEQPREMSIEKK